MTLAPQIAVASLVLAASLACTSTKNRDLEVRSGVVAVHGGETYYEDAGLGDALVLVHGGFGDRRMWDDHFASLARGHRVVRFDLRGFGRSPAPHAAYSPVDDLLRLLDALAIERATLVGNSMGGALALDFALTHPERVAGLVFVASGIGGFPDTPEDEARFAGERTEMRKAFESAFVNPDHGVELWLQSPMVATTSVLPATSARLRTMIADNRSMFALEHWPFEPLDPPAVKRLSEVRAPTLVVAGGRDTPWMLAASRRAHAGIAGSQLVVIEGADHLPHMAAPREFRAALDDFLAR